VVRERTKTILVPLDHKIFHEVSPVSRGVTDVEVSFCVKVVDEALVVAAESLQSSEGWKFGLLEIGTAVHNLQLFIVEIKFFVP
jgi:hypothetical protein